jgi:hypothetical protein
VQSAGFAAVSVLVALALGGKKAERATGGRKPGNRGQTERSRALVADDVNVPSVTSFLSPTT